MLTLWFGEAEELPRSEEVCAKLIVSDDLPLLRLRYDEIDGVRFH